MIIRILLVVLTVILAGCTPKSKSGASVNSSSTTSQGTEVKMQLKTMEDAQSVMDRLMTQHLGFRPTTCRDPSDEAGYVIHCFVSKDEPEQLLKKISQQLSSYGEESMAWRQDIGYWVSTYRLTGRVEADLLISLVAPGVSSSLQKDSELKNEGTYAWYILGPHS